MARLVAGGAGELAGFLTFLAPHEVDMEGEPESFVETSLGRRLLVLAQCESQGDGAQGADCVFWRENEGCSVYPHRPSACRTYPFEPEVESEGEGRRVHLRVHPEALCAPSTGIGVFGEDSLEAPDDDVTRGVVLTYDKRQRELVEYVERVTAWNRRQRRRQLAGHRAEPAEAFLRSLSS